VFKARLRISKSKKNEKGCQPKLRPVTKLSLCWRPTAAAGLRPVKNLQIAAGLRPVIKLAICWRPTVGEAHGEIEQNW
jgi:hypothetical protein